MNKQTKSVIVNFLLLFSKGSNNICETLQSPCRIIVLFSHEIKIVENVKIDTETNQE